MPEKRIYLASPTTYEEEKAYIREAFETNWIAPAGPNISAFEKEVADYLGCTDGAAVSSGTAAIHLAMRLLGVKEGDVVLCPSLTFIASANPILYEKGVPVFVDSEYDTWNMSPEALRMALQKYPQTKAVLVVHLYGTPAKMREIQEICESCHVPLIEDAAESMGAVYRGRRTGTFGQAGILSFNGNKIITTSGGGMLVSNKKFLIDRARFLATQAKEPTRYYEHRETGYNYRMSNILAGVGRGQLRHLEEHIRKKRWIYETYQKGFADMKEIHMNPYDTQNSTPNFWLSAIQISRESQVSPEQIIEALERENIESRPIWKPMHLQPVFQTYDFVTDRREGEQAVSEALFQNGVCLPSDIKNTAEDMERIIRIVRKQFV